MNEQPIAKLFREANEIIAMAEDLANRGFPGEAACFALAAAQRLQLIRIFRGNEEGTQWHVT
jgi:hypothetical protein